MARDNSGGIGETIRTIFWAGLIALFVRTVAYEPFNIPSGSMIPTLLIGDYLFVSKYSYGYSRYSLPFGLPLLPAERVLFSEPEQGDVAVFKYPGDNKTDYIKRIVGLPGDRLQMVGGVLQINGQPVQRERTADFVSRDASGNILRHARYVETLPNGRKHAILEVFGDHGPVDNTGVYAVPPGHYFAMGDNRDSSRDSRFPEVGFVPRENLVGRAEVLFFSVDGSFWEFWKWPKSIRFGRIFSKIG